jgi:CDGSH iron-sulfur domain-containing protein 1
MARLVEKTAKNPIKVEGPAAICACGLSKNQPYCDGSHRQTHDEDDSKLYLYEDGKRKVVERK